MIYLSMAVYLIAATLSYSGFIMVKSYSEDSLRFQNRIISKGKLIIRKNYSKTFIKELSDAGHDIKRSDYEFYRTAGCICIFLVSLATGNEIWIAVSAAAYFLSMPVKDFKGCIMPFGIAVKVMKKKRGELINEEIYEGISYIRNYIAVNPPTGTGTDSVIEQLILQARVLKTAYTNMLSHLRLNDREGALQAFFEVTGEEAGSGYGRMLLQLDELPVVEIEEILISYQKNMREMRLTEAKRKDEIISDIVYLPVVANALLIFVDFIYIAYFIEQQEALNALFGV